MLTAAAALRCTISALLTHHTFNSIKPLSSSSSYIHHYPQIPNHWSGPHNWRHGPPTTTTIFGGPMGLTWIHLFRGAPASKALSNVRWARDLLLQKLALWFSLLLTL
ncbi:hypothetical protein DM860_014695 [Cuscuta australis]|uniref:Uncharacterized protein n=1 Tax=Cuscuta australis TaxID=267555 RepID=A0A328DHE8_9ASTE|nr:hypothetical protein DM860_014695 [Cuscuta australis]